MERCRVSSKSENQRNESREPVSTTGSLSACLVDGDTDQLARARRLHRRSLLISVIAQTGVLSALILIPILSKTERIALANVMPMPSYHRIVSSDHTIQHQHQIPRTHGLSFCLRCPPLLPRVLTNRDDSSPSGETTAIISDIGAPNPECLGCIDLLSKGNPQPTIPRAPTPTIVHVTHLDPAMLIHRVEPVFPALARQTRHEGTVELRAIIATDGAVRSMQFLEGDALFYQSALDAVSQWHYKPTVLNGRPVEVDTHITVMYKLNR
jgi:protein TonB